jgi:hypothetical protein
VRRELVHPVKVGRDRDIPWDILVEPGKDFELKR